MVLKYNFRGYIGKSGQKIKAFLRRTAGTFPLSSCLYQEIRNLPRYPAFVKEFLSFKKASGAGRFEIGWKNLCPRLGDKTATTLFDRQYVLHTAWAARILACTLPEEHVDISSSIYFVALVSAFIKVKFYDYRPADIKLSGLQSGAANLTALPFPDMSVPSLSCMSVVEHVGLGRYGDPLDYNGDLKAIYELKRVLAKGGNLLFAVPVGEKPKLMFNAHRIYSFDQVISYFEELELMDFALIPEAKKNGGLIEHATKEMADAQTMDYGCGCFWFRKKEK